jgi:hypothetical protein
VPFPRTSYTSTKYNDFKKRSIFRGIANLSRSEATPRKKKLMEIIEKKEDHVRKLKKKCKDHAHSIKALSNLADSNVVTSLFKDMPSSTADFLLSQIRCAKRHPKGRRWTMDEKVVALALYKRSPKCYNLLKKIVAMPSRKTVLALLQNVPFHVGINEHLFKHMFDNLPQEEDRMYVLLFNEMDISQNLQYDAASDRILGFEELVAGDVSDKYANRALVFMCHGLVRQWKQPVAYYFSNNGCSSIEITRCLHEVLFAAKHVAQLDIVASICDMGSSNVKAMKEMGVSVEQPFFVFEEKEICVMYDPPHLLKPWPTVSKR